MSRILLLVAILFCAACEKQNCEKQNCELSPCVNEQIQVLRSLPLREPPAEIWQYKYKGKTVYYIPSACCDIPSAVLDMQCQPLCSPGGGIAGEGDCPEFFMEASHGRLIWKDERE